MRPPTREPMRRRSRSARPATASSSGRSPKSKASLASGRGASSAARSTTCCRSARRACDGVPIGDDADAPSVAISRLGQAEVAYRQPCRAGFAAAGSAHLPQHAPRRRIGRWREIPAAPLAGRTSVSAAVRLRASGRRASTSTKADMRLLYDGNGTPRVVEGNDRGLARAPLALGPAFAGAEPVVGERHEPRRRRCLGLAERRRAGHPAVAVREDFPSGAVQTALVSGGAGGEVGELAVGRSGLGDGLVAFRQGPFGNAAIVAAQVTAPPAQPFVITVPKGWVRPAQARVSWQPATARTGRSPTTSCSTVTCCARRRAFSMRLEPARPGLRSPPRAGAGHRQRRPVHADGAGPVGRRRRRRRACAISRAGGATVRVLVLDRYAALTRARSDLLRRRLLARALAAVRPPLRASRRLPRDRARQRQDRQSPAWCESW